MKIGILTYHHSVNNGAVMQAYSLAQKIKDKHPDCDVEIVDYQMERINNFYSFKLGDMLKREGPIKLAKRLILDPQYLRRGRIQEAIFKDNLKKLPLSPEKITSDEREEAFRYINARYDVLVVGSDAIWNYKLRGFPNAYLPDSRVSCTKMSYAASCYGMEFYRESENEKEEIRECLSDFSFIGVRDQATEDFVKWSGCEIPPVHTCDPTVFLDVDSLPVDKNKLEKKLRDRGFDFEKPAIGIMGNSSMLRMVRKIYGNKFQIVAVYKYVKGANVNLYDLDPFEWAYVFRYFKMTFTTFFHGLLLSLRNGVPAVCIALDTEFTKVHIPKTLDLLKRIGFENWYYETDYASVNLDLIEKQANTFLENDYRQEILDAMDREAESFEVFDGVLCKMMNKKGKNNG